MKYAIHAPNFATYSDPRAVADLAREAEDAGWDGFFLWDHVFWKEPQSEPVADTWTMLAAMAARTTRITRAILMDTPLSIDKGEVTDKGSINQRAVLEHRSLLIEELYAANPSDRVISVG